MTALAVALAVAAFVADKPASIACDVPESAIVNGWTAPELSSVIHLKPSRCDALAEKPGAAGFASSLSLVIHEAAHLRGVRSEACAELWANLAVYDVLRRFYGVPFFSPLSWRIGAQVVAITHRLPPIYQPTASACEAERGAVK